MASGWTRGIPGRRKKAETEARSEAPTASHRKPSGSGTGDLESDAGLPAALDQLLNVFDEVSGSAFFILDAEDALLWASERCGNLFDQLDAAEREQQPAAPAPSSTQNDSDARHTAMLPRTIAMALEYATLDSAKSEPGENTPIRIAVLRIDERPYRLYRRPLDDGRSACVLRDASEQEELSRTKHEIVANISHDLRTPLTSIGLLVDRMLRSGDDEPGLFRAAANRISEQLRVLEGLADDLVALNRLDSGRALLRLQPEHLREIVDDMIGSVLPQSEARAVDISTDVDPEIRVLVDRSQIERVLRNLLDNALYASPDGGTIRVSAERLDDRGMIDVQVEDEGTGIPEEDLERVFLRFFRGDVARTRPGTGLGLAIAKHIVEAHGGQIRAANRPPPLRGAVLRFSLLPAEGR